MKTLISIVLTVLALAAPAHADWASDVTRLLDRLYEADQKSDPLGASIEGDRRFDHLWSDASAEGLADRLREYKTLHSRAQRLRAAMPEDPDPDRLIDLELAEFVLERVMSQARHHGEQTPMNQMWGPFIEYPQLPGRLSFTTEKHYRDYIKRLRALPAHLRDLETNLRAGLAAGRTPPRIVLRDVPQQAEAVAGDRFVDSPRDHPMYAPFRDPSSPAHLRVEALKVMRESVIPAWRAYADFIRDEYVPGARESLAAIALPDGEAFYADQVAYYTTTEMTPDEIHELGLSEVARIRSEMFGIIEETGFADEHGDLEGDALFAAFTEFLRTDERFYFDTPDELLAHYRDICKRMDAELPELFGRLPRLPYGVKALPDFVAPSAPTAYYYEGSLANGVAGYFMANTYNLAARPSYEGTALALHEAVPGHHLQGSLAQELAENGQHKWRTTLYFTPYGEGWGLYSERLGLEVGSDHPRGMYADPYDEFGRLSYEMWRAMRLVVDTGIHSKGWTRQEGIDYMVTNAGLSEANVIAEVDRYIAWPGQALGYKIGELFIRRLRARAEGQLQDAFDLRLFHDEVLSAGATTLPILERRIDAWIESRREMKYDPDDEM